MKIKSLISLLVVVVALQGCGNDNSAAPPSPSVAAFPASLQSLVVKVDANNDGLLNAIHSGQYSYDEIGVLTQESWECDHNFNGVIDNKEFIFYNESGTAQQGYYFFDDNDDYLIDSTETKAYSYNSAGLLVGEIVNVDQDQDGQIETTYTNTYSYDTDGNRIEHARNKQAGGVSSDYLASYAYTFLPDGKVATYIVTTSETSAASDEIKTYAFTYNAAGNAEVMVLSTDTKADGISDRIETKKVTYLDATHLLSLSAAVDADGDGNPESLATQTFTYDPSFRPIQVERIVVSLPDETPLYSGIGSTRYSADGKEVEITMEIDADNDGSIDFREIIELVFNESGMTNRIYQWEVAPQVSLPYPLVSAIIEGIGKF